MPPKVRTPVVQTFKPTTGISLALTHPKINGLVPPLAAAGPRPPMITTQVIETAPGLVFDVSVAGPADGPLVLMLHGFGVSRYLRNAQVEALARAGYRTAAPNQRGYALNARPDPTDHQAYRIDNLLSDAREIAGALPNPEAASTWLTMAGAPASPGRSPMKRRTSLPP